MIIIEGALKAATVQKFRDKYDILANAGVICSHKEIVTAARFRPLFIAFDADYYGNIHVARALARLLNSIFVDALSMKFQPRIKIFTWNFTWNMKIKGIDDALIQNILITPKSLFEWFDSLSDASRQEIRDYFKYI